MAAFRTSMSGPGRRWLFLFFTSLTFFATEFVVDQTSVLNGRLQGTAPECHNGKDNSCLDFNSAQFNGLYAGHFWSGAVGALSTGFLVSKIGIYAASWVSAVLLFIGIDTFDHSINRLLITVGPYCQASNIAFGLMFAGRAIYALGFIGNITISHEVKSHWFRGKELALSFAVYISSCRVGSVITYAAVGEIVSRLGLQTTLWITFPMGLIGVCAAIVSGWIYHRHARCSEDFRTLPCPTSSGEFSFHRIRRLERDFWILLAIVFCFYSVLFTYLIDGPKFLMEIYGYSEGTAGLIIGAIPDVSLLAPLMGLLIDKLGRRSSFTFAALALFLAGFVLQLYASSLLVGLACILVGGAYSVITASVWSSIAVVSHPDVVGIAMGFAVAAQATGSGLLVLATGFVLNDPRAGVRARWTSFFLLMVAFAVIAWILSAVSFFLDLTYGRQRLHLKQGFPAIAADENQFADECSPLVS